LFAKCNGNSNDYVVENPSHVDESKERINKIFVEMTKQRYITRVHPLDLNLKKTEGTDLQTSTSKPTRIMPSDDAKEISDDGITIRTIPSKRKLNLSSSTVPVELQLMIDAEEEKNRDDTDEAEVKYGDSISRSRQSKKRKLSKRAQLPLRGEKKLSSAQTSDHESSVIEERSLVWRYGSEQLICDLRHRACVRFASENINSVASQIVFSMLRYSSPHERGRAEITSFPVNARDLYSMHDVKEALPKDSKDSWRLLLNYITVMCRDKSAMVMKVAAESFDATQSRPCDGGQYVVHMKNIIDFLKQSTYHSFIRERFGAETARIVRLLAEKRQLEQKTIAELALLPSHEARRRLYELLTHGLVKMQEIPKRSDHNPAFTLYCWSVNAEGIEKMITERIFHSLCKLRRRRKFEADENKELIARSDQLVESNDLGKFEKLSRALDRLDRAMIQLDDMLMLFCDF
jgi:DNA-directed RNA polymerase III subunit RPC3